MTLRPDFGPCSAQDLPGPAGGRGGAGGEGGWAEAACSMTFCCLRKGGAGKAHACVAYLMQQRASSHACAQAQVGIGGRLDATNIIPAPAACGITSLGFDHMEMLGDTLPVGVGPACMCLHA